MNFRFTLIRVLNVGIAENGFAVNAIWVVKKRGLLMRKMDDFIVAVVLLESPLVRIVVNLYTKANARFAGRVPKHKIRIVISLHKNIKS